MPPTSDTDPSSPKLPRTLQIDAGDLQSAFERLNPIDDLAVKESDAFADEEDLEKVAKKNDHHRIESLRDLVHQASRALFGVCACILELAIIYWAWHLLLPSEFGFLTSQQLDRIQTILTTILLSGVVGGYAKRVMANPKA